MDPGDSCELVAASIRWGSQGNRRGSFTVGGSTATETAKKPGGPVERLAVGQPSSGPRYAAGGAMASRRGENLQLGYPVAGNGAG